MNYVSPIEVITTQIRTTYEKEILNAVHNVGVIVDKEELEKALVYDRNQYAKGFSDGKEKTIDHVLEIIDVVGDRFEVGDMDEFEMFEEIQQGVLALKGEQYGD